ncbi:hypothetical protein Hanom_Chr15g01338131 [Helianthus anomalus]
MSSDVDLLAISLQNQLINLNGQENDVYMYLQRQPSCSKDQGCWGSCCSKAWSKSWKRIATQAGCLKKSQQNSYRHRMP